MRPTFNVWNGSYVADNLNIDISNPEHAEDLSVTDTIGLALRVNPKRAHLLVSKLLGKHIPASPSLIIQAGETLGFMAGNALNGHIVPVQDLLQGIKAQLVGETTDVTVPAMDTVNAVCIGYAETATSLGQIVANYLNVPYIHSTRYGNGAKAYGKFEEAHSHATSHELVPDDDSFLNNDLPLILVDDEISTGKTIIATIEELQSLSPRKHYVVCSLIDCRQEKDIIAMEELAQKHDIKIDVLALAKGEVTLPDDILDNVQDVIIRMPKNKLPYHPSFLPLGQVATITVHAVSMDSYVPAYRGVTSFDDAMVEKIAHSLPPLKGKTIVLGTEEFMYLPLRLAALLEARSDSMVYSSSTTRSPVIPYDGPDYAVRTKRTFSLLGEDRFVYNVDFSQNIIKADFFQNIILLIEPGGTYSDIFGDNGLVDTLSKITENIYILQGESTNE